jgi:hypothetical protein
MKTFSYADFLLLCESKGLNPRSTSLHKAECISLGLDPENTTSHALDCVRHELDPNNTSLADLKKHKEEEETYQDADAQ